MPGSTEAVTLEQAQQFFARQQADGASGIMIKAIGGGGGRGMRAVTEAGEVAAAYQRCRSEAQAAFGVDGVYVERLMSGARHIEIQLLGDGSEWPMALGERECTLQRRFQKLVEIAPSPSLTQPLRERITEDALRMAARLRYESLGTFEFLVDLQSESLPYVFIEANPRLQVEHTITEEVFGVDLVQAQIRIAAGEHFADLGLNVNAPPRPRGYAMQWRINAETLDAQGNSRPGSGRIAELHWPQGPGIRLDSHAQQGPARRRTTTPCWPSSSCTATRRISRMCCAAPGARWPTAASRAWPPICRCCRPWPSGPRCWSRPCTRAGWKRSCRSWWMLQKR
jgi:acetyl/propionyl-CoA carboxylase alpha subunit